MSGPVPLLHGCYYHIYNRGTNGEPIFREDRNYRHFLKLYASYIVPIADSFAYCLLNNHFHFLVRIKTVIERQVFAESQIGPVSETGPISAEPIFKLKKNSRHFNNFFIAYAKAFNKAYQRTGALFESPFKRKLVDNARYFTSLVTYIHQNPQKHGFVDDFRDWPYSSYGTIVSEKPTRLERETVLDWFGGRDAFQESHVLDVDENLIEPLIVEDWV